MPIFPPHAPIPRPLAPHAHQPRKAVPSNHMKGIVFTEFLELVEQLYSPDMVDDLIESCELPSRGIYTAVGTYPHNEIVNLLAKLSEMTGLAVGDLLKAFGSHLFGRFHKLYPVFFEGIDNAQQFLATIEDVIHVEVRKLYPDAELPRFDATHANADCLELIYRSDRHMGDLAEGLIEGCVRHFAVPHRIERENREDLSVLFRITRQS